MGWLAMLLAAPNRTLTARSLRGDPSGKLAGDATLGPEFEKDREGISAIKCRLQEIEAITDTTGSTDKLECEKIALLNQLKGPMRKMLDSQLRRDHRNIATQLRTLIRKKLKQDMPLIAAHLRAAIKLDFPDFGYYPPRPAPNRQF